MARMIVAQHGIFVRGEFFSYPGRQSLPHCLRIGEKQVCVEQSTEKPFILLCVEHVLSIS